MEFVKMHGLGNDFILIDCTGSETMRNSDRSMNGKNEKSTEVCAGKECLTERQIRQLCDRHFGIGADGIICICRAECPQEDFRMVLYNADGSRAQMCGNGIRCLGKYVYDHGKTKKRKLTVKTDAGVRQLQLYEKTDRITMVRVDMGTPDFVLRHIPARFFSYHPVCVSMGNPHCVLFADSQKELEAYPLEEESRILETSELFTEGINVEVVWIENSGRIHMRVRERGCGETRACGTGACAAAVAAMQRKLCGMSVEVVMRGGTLRIQYDRRYGHLYLTGPAEEICYGNFRIEEEEIRKN